ncbi:MAG TPA: PKD domain-containing protein [Solirubrobacteraceae bacterium]
MRAVPLASVVCFCLLLFATPAVAADRVLVLASTVDGANSFEVQRIQALGLEPELVTDGIWASKTASDFASYRAIVLGDPHCQADSADAAVANADVWGPAISGNAFIIGGDTAVHEEHGSRKVVDAGIDYAVGQPGKTGVYISLSCGFYGAQPYTPVPLLEHLSTHGESPRFTVHDPPCYDGEHVVVEHSAFLLITDELLSGWGCSVNQAFDTYPDDFLPLAIDRNGEAAYVAPDGTSGTPYILVRGNGTVRYFGRHMVALGDSVSAGEGIGEGWRWHPDEKYRDARDDEPAYYKGEWQEDGLEVPWLSDPMPSDCHQTEYSHPRVAAATLHAWLVALSCTGSSSFEGVLNDSDGTPWADAQLGSDVIAGAADPNPVYDAADPDLVTLSLGANDVKFSDVVYDCAVGGCTSDLTDDLEQQKDDVRKVLEEIQRRGVAAGKVPLVLLTQYVNPFPVVWDKRCRDLDLPWAGLSIENDEMQYLLRWLHVLNDNLRELADEFWNVSIVAEPGEYHQHHFCTADPWTFGASIDIEQSDDPSPFHPTIEGQAALAESIVTAADGKLPVVAGPYSPVRFPSNVQIRFSDVSTAGSVLLRSAARADLPPATTFSPSAMWTIDASAVYSGSIGLTFPGGPGQSIYHFTGGSWHQLATDYGDGYLNATTDSLSPFAIGTPTPEVTAEISAPVGGLAPADLAFDASASSVADGSAVESYEWDFGDGHVASDAAPTHRFAQSGTYTVTVTVRSQQGATDVATASVIVTNLPPVAKIDGPARGEAGEELTFTSEGSSDPNGEILDRAFEFDGGGEPQLGATVRRSFSTLGEHTVTLRVRDAEGEPGVVSAKVVIVEPAPRGSGDPVATPPPGEAPQPTPIGPPGATRPPLPAKATVTVLGWRRGKLYVRLGCPGAAPSPCTIVAALRTRSRRRLARTSRTLAPGRTVTVALKPRRSRVAHRRLLLAIRTTTEAGVTRETRSLRSVRGLAHRP